MKSKLFFLFVLLFQIGFSQTEFTPYDQIPGIIKTYKPAYQSSYPDWAKMLYQYPVNYFEINEAFSLDKPNREGDLAPIIRYYKIWKRAVEPLVQNDGTIIIPDIKKAKEILYHNQLEAKEKLMKNMNSESDWSFLGPKETFWLNESGSSTPPNSCPWQVNVYSFDVAATNPNILYCGTETGFVNKSIDKGLNWELCAPNYSFGGGVTATAIHPLNSQIVYVAAGNQIHKTENGGETWTPMLETNNLFHADRLSIDMENPDKIIAAASTGVYISSDGGFNWSHPWTSVTYDAHFKTNNSQIILALTKTSGKFAVIKSVDGGASFEADINFPTDISESSGGLLAVTPANPDLILAVMLTPNNLPLLYKGSMNAGTWELLAAGQSNQLPMNNGQGYFDLILEISPIDDNLIFAGTTTLYKSSNGGAQFFAIGGYSGSFSIHPDIQDMKLLPNGETWVATDGGFSITTDQFSSGSNYFSRNNGIVGSDMWGFHQGWNEDLVVGGRYHNGNTAIADFYQSKALRMGGAESPTGWIVQGKSRHAAFNDLGNGWILPPTAEGQPEGRFIFSKYPNMDEYGGRRGNLVFHPNYFGTIYLGEGNAIWKSTDMGLSYEMLHDFSGRVMYIDISYKQPNILYADIVNQGLYKSEDGGLTWTAKPSLTSSSYGGSYWKGKTFFVISPNDANTIYACLNNGTWSSDIGEVFKSSDGGDTWEDWTGSLSEYTKCLVIQPDENGDDLLYLFSNARNGQLARVFKRGENQSDWEAYENNYPAGFYVNLALPFYRDSKLRVAGNGGVWESEMAALEFPPLVNPWVEKSSYDCVLDTLYFDDHSMMNHAGASWHWEINPQPVYLEDANIRNPKVVLGEVGSYDVKLTVTKNGETYEKEILEMVSASSCPSIDDCFNPAALPKDIWELVYVDSEEVNYPGLAIMSFDDDPETIWHTRWSTGSDPYPHEIQVDMGEIYKNFNFTYLARQDGENGRIKEYELYMSEDGENWGLPVSSGEFINTGGPQTIEFLEPQIARYFRLKALSEVNGNEWASAAEFSMVGCTDITTTNDFSYLEKLEAFPLPAHEQVSISLPSGFSFQYFIFASNGNLVEQGQLERLEEQAIFNMTNYSAGLYMLKLVSENGTFYHVKILKD